MPLFRRPGLHAALMSCRWRSSLGWLSVMLAAVALAAGLNPVSAQSPTGGVVAGTLEPRPGGWAGERCLLRELATGVPFDGVVAPDGSFLLPNLPPGRYEIELRGTQGVQIPGSPVADSSIDVRPGAIVVIQLVAVMGQPGRYRLVTTSADGSQSASSDAGISDLPDLAPDSTPDQDADGLPSRHGLPSTQNELLVEGLSGIQAFNAVPVGAGRDPAPDPDDDSDSAEQTTGPSHGLSRGRHAGAASNVASGVARAFNLGAGNYSAQTGRGGAVVSQISQGGSSLFHGEAFFGLRSQALAATEPLAIATSYSNGVVSAATVKPHDLRLHFGGTVSGPVRLAGLARQKLFFVAATDLERRANPAVSSPADPDFYRLTAIQRALLANRGVTVAATDAALDYVSSLTGPVARRTDQTVGFGRLDWRRHPLIGVSVEGNFVRWNRPAGLTQAPVVARGRGSLGSTSGSLDTVQVAVTTALSPRTLNTVRVQFLHDLQYENAQANLPQEPGVGFGFGSGRPAPEVNLAPNGLLFGTPANLAAGALPDERRLEIADTLTFERGHHAIAIGADVSFLHDRVATSQNTAGTFLYDSGTTRGAAGGLVDFITDYTFNVGMIPNGGCPSINAAVHLFCFRSYTQSFGQKETAYATQEWAGFVEDTWRVRPRLTLHAGVRYDYMLLPLPAEPNPALDAVFSARGASSIFPEDRNNFGPRVSLAAEPFGSGRLTVRVGYGIFYGRLAGATLRAPLTETALRTSVGRIRIRPATQVVCAAGLAQGFGYPCTFATQPQGAVVQTASAAVFDRRFRLPVIQQGSLTLERGLGRRTSVRAGYVVNLDRQLPGSTDLNLQPSTSTATFQLQGGTGAAGVRDGERFVLPLYTARITPGFGPVTAIVSHSNGSYHALELAADVRISQLAARMGYTWSKAIDDAPALSATPRTNGQLDPYTNGYDKGISSLHSPWGLHAGVDWRPAVHGSRRVQAAVNGWEVGSIFSARAGRPYSLDISGGSSLPGGHLSLNGSGGALYLPTVGRNTLRLSATYLENLRVRRSFGLGHGMHGEVLAEAFNLFNHRNVSSINQRAFIVGPTTAGVTALIFQDAAAISAEGLNTTPFGTPNAASSQTARARQVQLQARVTF